jgi:ankyrin repeat protein
MLLERGANIDTTNVAGQTPLDIAMTRSQESCATTLRTYGKTPQMPGVDSSDVEVRT